MQHSTRGLNEIINSIKADQEELLEYIENWKHQTTSRDNEELTPIIDGLYEIIKLDDLVEMLSSLKSETRQVFEIRAIIFMGILPGQIDFLDTKVEMRSATGKIGQSAKKQWKKLKAIVQQFLQGISNYIWSLLAKFANPKGWSVTGGINAGFPGLSGTVQLQIQF